MTQEPRRAAGVAATEQAWNARQLRALQRPAWRLWRYRAPAVVLGLSQRELARQLHDAPLAVLQRRSGGGAVLVGPWMIGVSVALPAAHRLVRDGPVPAYRWLGEALARALSVGGVQCSAVPPGQLRAAARPAAAEWACFGGLSPWEVVCSGRKIAGLAQVRTAAVVLLVGGVLLQRPDWELLCAVLRQPADEARRLDAATCAWQQAAGGAAVDHDALCARLRAQLRAQLRAALVEQPPGAARHPPRGASAASERPRAALVERPSSLRSGPTQ